MTQDTPTPAAANAEHVAIYREAVDAVKRTTDTEITRAEMMRSARSAAPSAPQAAHPATVDLVNRFSAALVAKLAKAEAKYGYSDHWVDPSWQTKCQADLSSHVAKGDPLDVAAYAAFCWHHGWPSSAPQAADGGAGAGAPVAWADKRGGLDPSVNMTAAGMRVLLNTPPDHLHAFAAGIANSVFAAMTAAASDPTTQAEVARLTQENERLRTSLTKIDAIRNSIIGLQTINWSEHIYPLVAALEEAGLHGLEYDKARGMFGTMLERTKVAEAEVERLTTELASLHVAPTDRVREAAKAGWNACRKAVYAVCEDVDREFEGHRSDTENAPRHHFGRGGIHVAKSIARGFGAFEAEDDDNFVAAVAALAPDAAPARRFTLGDLVQKTKGAAWRGTVVGFYSTALTPIGYAVESLHEPGSVQIYPEAALAPKEPPA